MTAADPLAFSGTERFEIRRRVGAGAMGVVFEAFDHRRQMRVALKTIRDPAPAALQRFKRELRALAGIAHPNLVGLHELHCEGGVWFFTMELLDAVDLGRYVGVPCDEHRLRAALAQLAQGVAALHAAGWLHRDIKPSNILVTDEPRVVLVDFGLIAEVGRASGAQGGGQGGGQGSALIGTAAYAAPEQAAGEASPASDWYAVGVVLYELLTGALPFVGSSRAILFDKRRAEPQPVLVRRPDAPPDLAALCDALLRREPRDRPPGAEVLRRLDVAQPRLPGAVSPGPPPAAVDRDAILVGRDAELLALREALADAERGRCTAVHVRGVSGIGKTALLRAFVREPQALGEAVVLAGRCYPQESVPYQAVDSMVDALARFLSSLPAAEADAVLPRDVLLLAHVFPVLLGASAVARARRKRGPLPEPHELKRRAVAALRELVARIAEARPVAIVIDDLQWGDLDSAPFLDALASPPEPPAVALILAYRSEDEARTPLLAELRRHRERLGREARSVELTLEPLTAGDARALALALTGAAGRAAAIATESDGVPFLVHELAHAAARGAATIEQAIAARLGELGRAERTALEACALAARPVAREVLAATTGAPPPELERALAQLVAAHLLRVAQHGGDSASGGRYECYHDRLREAVAASLTAGRRRELHARLAHALALAPEPDREALVVHFEGAGERERAGEQALLAAQQAGRALAFDRAAMLYRTALRLAELDEAQARATRIALAHALAHAGAGAEAAEAYLAAAQGAPAADAIDLRRRAASQYLRTGRIEDGLQILDDALAEVGARRPRSPRRAIASLLLHRARLRLRGLGFARRDATRIAPYDLARLDVLWTAATDLGMVDVVVGADFAARQALLALSIGEPTRVARALLAEVMFLAAQGARARRRAGAVLARTQLLVAELADPELPAWIAAARGLAEYQQGRFRRAAEHGEEAVRRLREDCTGVLWQVGGVEVQVMWSLFYLGELRELAARAAVLVEQARLRGNRFDATNVGTGLPALCWAVADRTAHGRAEVERVIAAWSARGFHLQHYYALLALASFDLYEGDAAAARDRIEAAWPALVRSRLLVCDSVAIEAHHLRARAQIATGADPAGSLRALARYRGNPWADALLALARAGALDDPGAAAAALEAAVRACAAAELGAFAAAARRRLGALQGGAAGAQQIARADQELAAQSVRAPDTFARMLVPLRGKLGGPS